MKRIIAILCIIILVVPYIIALIASFMGSPSANDIFIAAIAATVILPVMMWVYLHTAKYLKKKGEKLREENDN